MQDFKIDGTQQQELSHNCILAVAVQLCNCATVHVQSKDAYIIFRALILELALNLN